MISIIVPTRNHAHTLKLVAPSYFQQALVDELIFVDDCSEDDSAAVVSALARQHPGKRVQILRNDHRRGAAYGRNRGFQSASNPYILFCDDDEYLERDYAAVCLQKMQETNAAIVSGRRVHKRLNETPEQALQRFGNGLVDTAPFNNLVCEFNINARYSGDIWLPLTNSIILTRKDLLERYGYDPFYAAGNGYREESDFQMNLYVHGYDILVTNEVHSIHLSRQECGKGGQRINRIARWYWSVYYTKYFYQKYYHDYAKRMGVRMSQPMALAVFSAYRAYILFIRPFGGLLYSAWR